MTQVAAVRLRIVIADDHPLALAGLREYLNEQEDMKVVAEACDGLELMGVLRHERADVVILDVDMPRRGGIEALRQIRAHEMAPRVIVFSSFPAEQYAATALRFGANAYLDKGCEPNDLLMAIRNAGNERDSALPAQRDPAPQPAHTGAAKHSCLNAREFQILVRLAKGESINTIALALSLTAATVSVYRAHMARKLMLSTNTEMTRYALSHGLI